MRQKMTRNSRRARLAHSGREVSVTQALDDVGWDPSSTEMSRVWVHHPWGHYHNYRDDGVGRTVKINRTRKVIFEGAPVDLKRPRFREDLGCYVVRIAHRVHRLSARENSDGAVRFVAHRIHPKHLRSDDCRSTRTADAVPERSGRSSERSKTGFDRRTTTSP